MANSAPTIESSESEKNLGKRIAKTTSTELSKGMREMWAQLLGGSTASSESAPHAEGDKKLGGVVFERTKHEKGAEKPRKKESAINYTAEVIRTERFSKREMNEVEQQINQIKVELKKLIASSRLLQMQFGEMTVEQNPVEIGNYHLNFFEWLIGTIKMARQNVESSGSWLNTSKKKGQDYWSMVSKHGQKFMQGMENNGGANQVG